MSFSLFFFFLFAPRRDENKDQVDGYLREAAALGVKRVAFRHQFGDERRWGLFDKYEPVRTFCGNPV